MTTIHFLGAGSVETKREWGGCNLVDYAGRLWRVANAVNRLDRVDVYAYRLRDALEAEMRSEFETWTVGEPGCERKSITLGEPA